MLFCGLLSLRNPQKGVKWGLMGHWKVTLGWGEQGRQQPELEKRKRKKWDPSLSKCKWGSDAHCSPSWNGYFSPFLNEELYERHFWLCNFILLAGLGAGFLTACFLLGCWGAFHFLFQEWKRKDEEEKPEFKILGWVFSIRFSWLYFTVEPVHPLSWGCWSRGQGDDQKTQPVTSPPKTSITSSLLVVQECVAVGFSSTCLS